VSCWNEPANGGRTRKIPKDDYSGSGTKLSCTQMIMKGNGDTRPDKRVGGSKKMGKPSPRANGTQRGGRKGAPPKQVRGAGCEKGHVGSSTQPNSVH